MPRVIGIIPARYGSTRFLGKPLVKIGHKSLLAWTYFHASLSTTFEDLLVATDDGRILEECKSFGAKAILTSPTHNSGTDRLCEVVSQIPETDLIVVNIQGDEPDIDPKLIDGVVNLKLQNRNWEMTTAACELLEPKDWKDPNRVKVTFDSKGKALYFSRSLIPSQWKSKVKVYRHLGIYCYEKEALLSYPNLPKSSLEESESLEQLRGLEAGFSIGVFVTEKAGLSVDTPEDLQAVVEEFQRRGLIN